MNVVSWIMALFAVVGAFDCIIGNKLGLGKEFEKGAHLLGPMMLSMVGMLVLTPLFTTLLEPCIAGMTGILDPSTIPALLFANDMGGASMSVSVANNEMVGKFNALVVSSMMGVTFSFTIPYALGVVKKEKQDAMFLGFLCGIVTIPVGCLIGGLILGLPILTILVNLLPLIVICIIIAIGLLKAPNLCIKFFSVFGVIIKALVTIGLAIGIFQTVTGWNVVPYVGTVLEAGNIIVSIACVLCGAFPFIHLLSKFLKKPIAYLGKKVGLDFKDSVGIVSTLASSAPTFGLMDEMSEKGIIVNSAFTISGAFIVGSHMAFTLAFSADCLAAVLIGKFLAGIAAIVVAVWISNRQKLDLCVELLQERNF